jgi:arylsulfatase A-like enzyme/lysophospholipase L1-like esterase
MKIQHTISVVLLLAGAVLAYTPEEGSDAGNKAAAGTWVTNPVEGLPNVLLLGDSISIGYTLQVRELLAGEANVFRPHSSNGEKAVNCCGTTRAVEGIDEWLAGRNWDVIHFNFGLHDLKHVDAETGMNSACADDPRQASVEKYAENLEDIIEKVEATGARLIFAATTPVPEGFQNPLREPDAPLRYNAAALEIMEARGIQVNDLYAFCEKRLGELHLPNNVHFNKSGNQVLGERVAKSIRDALQLRRTVPGTRPNILFLCMDDLKPTLGCYGDDLARTPNIDRLAARGSVFQNHYCQQALCAPSRMSVFTGLRPDASGVWDLKTPLLEACPSAVTMQQYFRENGYVTAGGGKVMHGARNDHPLSWSIPFCTKPNLPYAEGFDVPAHDGCHYQDETVQKVYRELNETNIKAWKARVGYLADHDALPSTECLDVPDDAYSDGALADFSIELLERFAKTEQPFFLTVGFARPHLPFAAPKKYWDNYDPAQIKPALFREKAADSPGFAYHTWGELRSYSDIPDDISVSLSLAKQQHLIRGYYASVSYVDAQVGRIMDAVKRLGLTDNMIVVLWGDHGWHLGDHDLWCKHSVFEQATRSPLIIVAPGNPGGQQVAGMVESVDIFPSLCDLSGLPRLPVLQGESLSPLLDDPTASVKEFSVSQYPRGPDLMGYALRTRRCRYVLWMNNNWRSTQPFDDSFVEASELYDYAEDPLETVSQAHNPEYANVIKNLKGMMIEHFKSMERP